jgi:hypothetical protein
MRNRGRAVRDLYRLLAGWASEVIAVPRLLNLHAHTTLRRISRALGKLVSKSEPYYEPDAQRLAEHLSRVSGSSLVWCSGCGDVLAPVVLGYGEQTEIVCIGCLNCGIGLPVHLGVIAGDG